MTNAASFLERRLFIFSLPGLLACALVVSLTAFAALAGKAAVEERFEAQQAFVAEHQDELGIWRDTLLEIERTGEALSPTDARPMNMYFPVVLPPGPLGDFATGSAKLLPDTTAISGWANPGDLFTEYEFENPTTLSLGGFDLTLVVVVLIPLIMIAASFDILAGDRETGRARMVAVQGGHIGPSIWRRLLIRNGAIWAAFVVTATAAALVPISNIEFDDRLARFLAWTLAALLYGTFWLAIIVCTSTLLKRAETVVSALFSVWAIFVFAVPAICGAIAETSFPPPSRLAFLSEMREGEIVGVNETAELTAGFLADHPDMTVSGEDVPDFFSRNFLANVEIRKRTRPVLEALEESHRNRSELVSHLQYLSPTLMADRALSAIAGGEIDRSLAFQRQARDALDELHENIGPTIVARKRISVAEFDALPAFTFQERSLQTTLADWLGPLAYLLILAVVAIIIARRRLAAPLDKLLPS